MCSKESGPWLCVSLFWCRSYNSLTIYNNNNKKGSKILSTIDQFPHQI